MSKVLDFPLRGRPRLNREARAITLEEFCLADETGEWTERVVVNRMTMLLYPAATLICCPGGNCSAVTSRGANVEDYFVEALAAIA